MKFILTLTSNYQVV